MHQLLNPRFKCGSPLLHLLEYCRIFNHIPPPSACTILDHQWYGHGQALFLGVECISEDFLLVFDSLSPCLPQCLDDGLTATIVCIYLALDGVFLGTEAEKEVLHNHQ